MFIETVKRIIWNHYKIAMLIPVLITIFSIGVLVFQYQTQGYWFQKGIEFRGGVQLSIKGYKGDIEGLESYLQDKYIVNVRKLRGFGGGSIIIEASGSVNSTQLIHDAKEYGENFEDYSVQMVGPALGKSFLNQSLIALIIAFGFMGVTVYLLFRTFVPSLMVILSAVSDLIGTVALMQLFNMNLTLASFAGLLLVLGYSIDTDILLTTRVLKEKEGTIKENCGRAVKTGLLMSSTTLTALFFLYLASSAPAIIQIASVLIIALILDIPNTWLLNMGLLRMYMER